MIEFRVFATLADFGSNKPVLVKRLECKGADLVQLGIKELCF